MPVSLPGPRPGATGLSPRGAAVPSSGDDPGPSGSPPATPAAARELQRPGVPTQSAPLPATGRLSPASPSQVGQAVTVDGATTVAPRGPRGGFDISRQGPDGARTVITQSLRPDGSRRVVGYRQIEDGRTGTTTRIYGDGRRVVWGRDFEQRSIGNGVDFVTRQDGRREATLPDGRPVYRDRFTTFKDLSGEPRRMIERTRYTRWWKGRPVYETRPVVRYYDAGFFYGAPVAYYRPRPLPPAYIAIYVVPFPVPLPAVAFGMVDEWVAFASTPRAYTDPAVLMGDMQIWSGFEEGRAYSAPWSGTSLYGSPQAASVRSAMVQMQQQAASQTEGSPFNPQQPGSLDLGSPFGYEGAPSPGAAVSVSEEVRLRVREQVRSTVALLQAGTPLTLGGVLAAPDAAAYLFQTAQPLVVSELSGGGECFLNTGDLIGFYSLPDEASGFAMMTVVASGPGSCSPRSVVPVSLSDLQEMLNGFAERAEDNLQRVLSCTASGSC